MKRLVAFLLFINIICSAASLGEVGASREECVLARSLSQWLDVTVTTEGGNLRFSGELSKIKGAIEKLKDFDRIREEFLPFSKGAGAIKSIPEPLKSWEECFGVLGIAPASVALFNQHSTRDNGHCLLIPAGDEFNGSVAKLYVDLLMKNSIFFKWIADNFKGQFIEKVEGSDGVFLAVNYGLLNQFLCLGAITIDSDDGKADSDDAHEPDSNCVLSKESVLRSLVAAGSGSISLQHTGANEYGVRFVSLGADEASSYPTVELVIDNSGSMRDEIHTVNKTVPILLERLRDSFPKAKVRIFSFNDEKKLEAEYDLVKGKPIPVFRSLAVFGSTNLGHIASSIPLGVDEVPKAVVAFTDGCHESTASLDDAIRDLRAVQASGRFALPKLFGVGEGSASSAKFFGDMAGIFGGSSSYRGSVDEFFSRLLRDIADISRPQTALTLQREGFKVKVDWFPVDLPGLYRGSTAVRGGDSIVDRHGSHVVSLPAAAEQMVAPALDAAAAKRATREKLLEEQRRLEAELAALGDDD